ncbi:MAG: hypothetical protein AAF810_01340 [Cyanobacteria bacterium P01_D01_bin.36]
MGASVWATNDYLHNEFRNADPVRKTEWLWVANRHIGFPVAIASGFSAAIITFLMGQLKSESEIEKDIALRQAQRLLDSGDISPEVFASFELGVKDEA